MISNLSKGKILIVDDEPLVLEIIQTVLKKSGFETTTSSSALEALNHIKKSSYDVIISDIRLEELTGIELLHFAKNKNPLTSGILITGAPAEEDRLKADELNAQYFIKPLSLEKISQAVENCFQNAIVQAEKISFSNVNLT